MNFIKQICIIIANSLTIFTILYKKTQTIKIVTVCV